MFRYGHSVARNQLVHFVGATSGLRSGTVDATCELVTYTNNRRILCQNKVRNSHVAGGDSGVPVFRITDKPNTNDVRLLGIVIAKAMNGYTYSPIGNIYYDLGSSLSWDSCDPSRNC